MPKYSLGECIAVLRQSAKNGVGLTPGLASSIMSYLDLLDAAMKSSQEKATDPKDFLGEKY